MSKHIVLSTQDPGVGGVAQYNHSLVCTLAKLGYRVTCLQPRTFNDSLLNYQEKLGIRHLWLEKDILEYLPEFFKEPLTKPDLIIFSNCNPFSNFAIQKIAIQKGIPYIIVEGLVEPHLAEQFASYLNELCQHYILAKSVIAVSFDNLNLLYNSFKLPRHQGKVIYYGRPSEYFTTRDLYVRERLRQDFNIPSNAVVCFTAARIETRKGYQLQLEAIKQLMLYSQVWSKLYFVWAGAGIFEPRLEKELKHAVEQLGISNKVIFLGQTSDILDWLNAADIFVLPSLLEGMPLAVMEAMAKGLPVIASAVSRIPEELGETGKLLTDPKIDPQATVKELVAAIQELAINSDLRQSAGFACKERAEKMFREERMLKETMEVIKRALLPDGDYVSPRFEIVQLDQYFPHMIVGNIDNCTWPYLRREIPHNWYVDRRIPTVGFLSRDEAHILYNTALRFQGKRCLEIGCWFGWSTCHLALAGVELDVIDPILEKPEFYESIAKSLEEAGVLDSVNLVGGSSPQKVWELATKLQRKWSLIFIDGNHEAPGPLNDAIVCEQLAAEDALILFHDLNSPDVAQGLDYLKKQGWNTLIYQTMQIMGVAWRGNVEPVEHQPDPKVFWFLPEHLKNYSISGLLNNYSTSEFLEIFNFVRPYTLLSEERLFSLYSLARQICLQDIPGNFVECGTCKGGSAALLAIVIQRYSLRPRLVYVFDAFEGMPENLTKFGVGTLKAPINEYLDTICKSLKVENIIIHVKGSFSQTLPKYKLEIGEIALLHANEYCYESTMDIFTNLYDTVVNKGLIQIDDYGHCEGTKKAIDEFQYLRSEQFKLNKIDYTGVWFQKSTNNKKLSPIILVDGVFFQLYQTGIARLWKSLLEEWVNNSFSKHIIVLDRAGTAPKIPGIRYRMVPAYNYANTDGDREMLQQVCDEENADLFISSYYTTPIRTPSVFMAYDMIPEVMGWDMNNPMWQEKHKAIQHASAYIAISKNTARDLTKFFTDIPTESVTVAHCGVKNIFSPATAEAINTFKTKYGISKPYFILVGIGGGYKNSILFFQAFSRLATSYGFDIICTGSGGILAPELRIYTPGSTVHMLQLDDDELVTAYSGAVALIYPSKYEGFGLPLLEAMACGCPVITCPNASIPEVAGEAAIYVKDDDIEELANALCEVQKPSVRHTLITAGLKQAKQFSWSKMADTISSVLVNVTLLPLNLKKVNLIIFPDWSQPEESLSLELEQVIKKLASYLHSQHITLLIEASNTDENYAELLLSAISMNLLMEDDLEVNEELQISFVRNLSEIQWQALLSKITARIILEPENQQALARVKAANIPAYELEKICDINGNFLSDCEGLMREQMVISN